MAKGTYWIYEGEVSWLGKDPLTHQNQVNEQHVKWRSEVVDTVEDLGAQDASAFHRVALLNGFPTDFVWSDPKTKPPHRLLFYVGTDYYQTTDKADETFQRIKGPGYLATTGPQGDTNRAELLLSTPLALGKRLDLADSIAAFFTDRYCHLVESVTPFDLRTVKHAPKLPRPLCYSITWHSNPDNDEMDFVPGLGITRYYYHHHGTTMDVDVHLVEFGPASSVSPAPPPSPPGPD